MKKVFYLLVVCLLAVGCTAKEQTAQQQAKTDYIAEGTALLSKGDSQGAIEKFKQEIAQDPQSGKAYFILGQTYMREADYKNALESFKMAAQLDPENGDAYLLLGGCYDLLGNKEEAIKSVQMSAEIFRKNKDEINFKRALAIYFNLTGGRPKPQ